MDKNLEQTICKNFFKKRYSDRLYYELSSKKKRSEFFNKMSHNAEVYLGNCIFASFDMPPKKEQIIKYLEGDICYFITMNSEYDGQICNLVNTLDIVWCNGMPYIIVNEKCSKAYLETEYDFTEHKAFFLT